MHARRILAGAVAILACAGSAQLAAQGKTKVQPVSLFVTGGLAVTGDDLGATFTDYRAESPSCVEVTVDQVFIRFNRHYPDSSTTPFVYCEQATGYGAPKRQYWIRVSNVDDPDVCAEFLAGGPTAQAKWEDDSQTTCVFNGSDKPRIRAADAFKARLNTRISVTFLILDYTNTFAYEVQATALVTGNSTSRTLKNVGTDHRPARVIRNAESLGEPDTVIDPSVNLPFELTLTKVPVQ